MKVLLLEDDFELQVSLIEALHVKKYEVHAVSSIKEALSQNYQDFDLAILDVWLPDGNGIDVCIDIRQKSDMPIIFLTANDLEETIIMGLNAGGDDYITKPFSLNVLFARIDAVSRRKKKGERIGDLLLDEKNHQVYKDNQPLNLTTVEYEIISSFIVRKGQILTRNQLLDIIERYTGHIVEDNTLTVHMKRIRDKLGLYNGKPYIQTVRGIGYRFYEK